MKCKSVGQPYWPRHDGGLLIPPPGRSSVDEYVKTVSALMSTGKQLIAASLFTGHYLKKVRVPGMTIRRARSYLRDLRYARGFVDLNLIGIRTAELLPALSGKWAPWFVQNGPWCFLRRRKPPPALVRQLMKQMIERTKSVWAVDSRHPFAIMKTPYRVFYKALIQNKDLDKRTQECLTLGRFLA